MLNEEWIKTLEGGRKVKFIYQELPKDGALITAQLAGNEVVYSVVLTNAGNPLSGWPAMHPSPKKSVEPKIATIASLPLSFTTVSFTLPF
jgi:hypothetical protein